MPPTRHPSLLIAAAVLGLAGCGSSVELSRPLPPPTPIGSPQDCAALRERPARYVTGPTADGPAWVLFEYALDGSGRALDVRLVDLENAGALAQEVLREARAAGFQRGAVRERCRELVERR